MSRWFEMKHTIFVVDFFSIKWVEVFGVGSFFLHVGSTSNTQVKIILDRKEIDLHVGRPYTNLESALLTDETPLRGNTNPPIYLRYAFGIISGNVMRALNFAYTILLFFSLFVRLRQDLSIPHRADAQTAGIVAALPPVRGVSSLFDWLGSVEADPGFLLL